MSLDLFCQDEQYVSVLFGQESLQRSRPDIISRSQCRVRELERRKQERRELAGSAQPHSVAAVRQRRVQSSPCASLNGSVPAAILTSPVSHTASRPIAAVVAAGQSHTLTQRTRSERDRFQPQYGVSFKAYCNSILFRTADDR